MPKIKVIPLLEVIFKNKRGTSELWKAVNELLQKKEQEISVFSTYIKHKINSYDKENSLLALDLLDFCMDNGDVLLWSHIGSKEFLSSLVTNLKTRDDTEIQSKILFLIEKWGNKFSNCKNELSNFQNVYMLLKSKNVSFPINMQSNYNKYVKYNNVNNNNNNFNNFNNNIKNNNNNNNSNQDNNINRNDKKETDPENYLRDINLDLNTSSYEKKYKKLVNKLYDWTHAIHEANVLINQNYNGKNNNKIADLVKDLSRGNKQLIETIESGKLKDETLMKISLCVTSDIDMTIQRWSKNKNGIFPNPFISSFFQNDSNMNENNYNNNYKYDFNYKNNNQNNDSELMNFYNVNNSTKYINKSNFGNNNNNNNPNSFNLLIDFNCDSAPTPVQNNQNMFNNNKSMNFNQNNNFNNFMDFVNKTEQNQMQNQNYNNFKDNILCKSNNNFNNNFGNNFNSINVSQSYHLRNKMNFNNMNNNNAKYNEYNNMENNNDNITSRQSLMYPSFDELNDE